MATKQEHFVTHTSNLMKSVDEDQRLFTAVVLRPEAVDSHGDIYSHDVVKEACHSYTANCMNTNLQHSYELTKADMKIVETIINIMRKHISEVFSEVVNRLLSNDNLPAPMDLLSLIYIIDRNCF